MKFEPKANDIVTRLLRAVTMVINTSNYDYSAANYALNWKSFHIYMGQYQIVVHFGYGSTMKYFVDISVFSLI